MLTKLVCDSKPVPAQTVNNLLLDDFNGATFAVSLDKLRLGYTGPCLRARRSGDNAESDFGFVNNTLDTASLLAWVNAGGGTKNAFVVQWMDQSGSGNITSINTAEQFNASYQPQIVSSGAMILSGGKPCVSFDGLNDFMELYLAPYITNPNIFWVIELKGDSSGQGRNGGIITFSDVDQTFNSNHFGADDDWYDSFFSGARQQISSQRIPRSRYVGEYLQNGSGLVSHLNNNSYGTVSAGIDITTTYRTIGNPYPQSNFPSNNNYQAIVLYPSSQATRRGSIEQSLNNQFQVHWGGATQGLINQYTGAAAAYSLRALNNTYFGPLIRVRRSSDNGEVNIYAKYDGTLDTYAMVTFCGGGDGFIVTWYDQSGNGRHGTQSTASQQPQIVSGGSVIQRNSRPSMLCSQDQLLLSSNFTVGKTYSIFTVLENTRYGDTFLGCGVPYNYAYYFESMGATRHQAGGGNSGFPGVGLDYKLLSILRNNTTSVSLFKNNALTGNANLSVNDDLTILNLLGDNYSTTLYNFVGYASEIILYQSDQSSNQSNISSNINSYYSIY
jgi:hypothetical protein